MDMEYYIIIKMMKLIGKNMKVITKMIKKKEKEYFIGILEIDMKVILKMI